MDVKTKIKCMRKAIGRLTAEVEALVEVKDYSAVAALMEEANNLNVWYGELEEEAKKS